MKCPCFYGKWAGHSLEQVEGRFGSINAAPGVEPQQLFEARVEETFCDAVRGTATDAPGGVALVAHDIVIKALLGRFVPGLDARELHLPTGSWSELEERPGAEWSAVRVGELLARGSRP